MEKCLVRIINGHDWYMNRIGEVFEVYKSVGSSTYALVTEFGVENNRIAIGMFVKDCVIVNKFKDEIDKILEL